MILVCGGLTDIVTELLCARLEHQGYAYRLFDQGRYPTGYRVAWTWRGGAPVGTIEGPDWRVDLAEVTGAFVRYVSRNGHAPFPSVPANLETAAIAECQAGLLALLEYLPCPVANRAAGSMSNHSKPYQARLVREVGLLTPRTLITSDPAAARACCDECGGAVIFKSLSGVRSIVRRIEARDLDRLATLRHGVAQFQAYVPRDNVRVHTVGDAIFATRVRSEAVDYRYAEQQGHALEMTPTTLPPQVAEACVALARAMNLCIAGIDLKESPDGEWICFEINPSPGFAFYEQWTGQPISAALADLLRGG
jgi:glutathione synthase/RimK-type ligase-like ATP-grasp enzyme